MQLPPDYLLDPRFSFTTYSQDPNVLEIRKLLHQPYYDITIETDLVTKKQIVDLLDLEDTNGDFTLSNFQYFQLRTLGKLIVLGCPLGLLPKIKNQLEINQESQNLSPLEYYLIRAILGHQINLVIYQDGKLVSEIVNEVSHKSSGAIQNTIPYRHLLKMSFLPILEPKQAKLVNGSISLENKLQKHHSEEKSKEILEALEITAKRLVDSYFK